jgi:hypothetical protein
VVVALLAGRAMATRNPGHPIRVHLP